MKHVMYLVRCVLWVALVGTTAFSCLLLYVFPPEGDVAQLIVFVVGVALVLAWIALRAWDETEEDMEYHRGKWALNDRLEAEQALNAKIQAVAPGGVLVLETLLKRLNTSRT